MDHTQLLNRMEHRLDKIEKKLDQHLAITSAHTADMSWIKGYIKLSLLALISLTGAIVTIIFT